MLGGLQGLLSPTSWQFSAPESTESTTLYNDAYNYVFLKNITATAAVLCTVAIISIWAGVDLLRRRSWARTTLQALGGLYVAGTVLWSLMYWAALLTTESPALSTASRFLALANSVFSTVIYIIATFVALRYLRGPQARAAVAGR
jgi:hypothetical protein